MVDKSKYNMVVVLGPTASGKTGLGVSLARLVGGEVISADSRQVYRGLDIGSGKDLHEFSLGGGAVPYHLIDVVDLCHEFSVFEYQQRFYAAFEDIRARGMMPVVVGGTGLYLSAVLDSYRMVAVPENCALRSELEEMSDEQLGERLVALGKKPHNTTDLVDRDRLIRAIEIADYSMSHEPEPAPDINALVLGTRWPRDELRKRIQIRLVQRIQLGMIEEVEGLIKSGVDYGKLEFLGLEYRFIADYLRGKFESRNDFIRKLATAICQFAKRQETWFRRMERQGVKIHWIDHSQLSLATEIVRRETKEYPL